MEGSVRVEQPKALVSGSSPLEERPRDAEAGRVNRVATAATVRVKGATAPLKAKGSKGQPKRVRVMGTSPRPKMVVEEPRNDAGVCGVCGKPLPESRGPRKRLTCSVKCRVALSRKVKSRGKA